jgi:CheY-like chemotaxis protein
MSTPCRILLVDDDPDDQMIFSSALNEINASIICECVDNAEIGLTCLKSEKFKPDFIFLDLNLPLMSGFEFLEAVKGIDPINIIPVVIFSTSSRETDKEKASELGAVDFISKPNTFAELKDRINITLKAINGEDLSLIPN